MTALLTEPSTSCSAKCRVTVAAILPLSTAPKILTGFEASLQGPDSENPVKLTAVNGQAKFENLDAGDYKVTIGLTDEQKKLVVVSECVFEKTQNVTVDEKSGEFIFQLTALPMLKVELFEDAGKTKRVAGIKVVAKPAQEAIKKDADNNGAADFGSVAAGDYELSLELTDEQKRRFKQIPKTTVTLANNEDKTQQIVLSPVATLTVKVARNDGLKLKGNVTVRVFKEDAEAKSTEVTPDVPKVTYDDLEPGPYSISVIATSFMDSFTRVGREITRTDAALTALPKTDERDETFDVPGQQVTTVSLVLARRYMRTQFVGYYLYTGPYLGSDDPTQFAGDADKAAEDDIAKRCKIMTAAIEEAAANVQIDKNADVMKIFMAPEFYFRGKQGAYPLAAIIGKDKTSGILPALQAETLKDAYKDWLFVFGTAVGYLKGKDKEDKGTINSFTIDATMFVVYCKDTDDAVHAVNTWTFVASSGAIAAPTREKITNIQACQPIDLPGHRFLEVTVENDCTPSLSSQFYLASPAPKACPVKLWADKKYKITVTNLAQAPQAGWALQQGDVIASILSVTDAGGGNYTLEVALSTEKTLDGTRQATLAIPGETEILNIALVQKGGPAVPVPPDGARLLKEAVIYKEQISKVDFQGPTYKSGRAFENENRHLIDVHGDPARRAIPAYGANALLSKNKNVPARGAAVSEVNKSGLGGGSVITIDGVDIGVEVCLDHSEKRLLDYYNKGFAAKGEPMIQVHLIPSCGMSISNYCVLPDGYVFNVDKSHCEVQKSDRTKVKPKSVTAIANTGGVTMTEHFVNEPIGNPNAPPNTIDSNKGYIVVYEKVDLPPRKVV